MLKNQIRYCLISCLLLITVFCKAQFTDNFDDGEYQTEPEWMGNHADFFVNSYSQLQLKAQDGGLHWLSTPCSVNQDAIWEMWCRIATPNTAYNNIRFYVISSTEDPTSGEGWYVQAGGKDKNITLRWQQADTYTTMISNSDRRSVLQADDVRMRLRLTLSDGKFTLYSAVEGVDNEFVEEGTCSAKGTMETGFFSICVRNTAKTGRAFYIDDISVTGKHSDTPIIPTTPSEPSDTERNTTSKKAIYATEESFSPNGDGYKDMFHIYYNIPTDGFSANIRIFTADGKLLRTIKQTVGNEGSIAWDGLSDNGQVVAVGIYVLYAELFNTDSGHRYQRKIPVAVVY